MVCEYLVALKSDKSDIDNTFVQIQSNFWLTVVVLYDSLRRSFYAAGIDTSASSSSLDRGEQWLESGESHPCVQSGKNIKGEMQVFHLTDAFLKIYILILKIFKHVNL